MTTPFRSVGTPKMVGRTRNSAHTTPTNKGRPKKAPLATMTANRMPIPGSHGVIIEPLWLWMKWPVKQNIDQHQADWGRYGQSAGGADRNARSGGADRIRTFHRFVFVHGSAHTTDQNDLHSCATGPPPARKIPICGYACRWHNRCLCRPTGNSAFPAGSSKINYNLSAAAERPEETDQCGQSEKRPGA